MEQGKPQIVVVGGSDTGRAPLAAALLRRAIGEGAIIRSAGVLAHEGERAAPEVGMALEQAGIPPRVHVARGIQSITAQQVELFVAVDRGVELVLHTHFPKDPRVVCLSVLAGSADVLDPHRMPLGVWITATRQLQDQIEAALPAIRQRLRIADSPVEAPPIAPEAVATPETPNDAETLELVRLLSGVRDPSETSAADVAWDDQPTSESAPIGWDDEPDSTPESSPIEPAPESQPAEPQPTAEPQSIDVQPEPVRPANYAPIVARMGRLISTAIEMPEIVEWQRVRSEVLSGLRAIDSEGNDLLAAATLLIEGALMRYERQPSVAALQALRSAIGRLDTLAAADDLLSIGRALLATAPR